MVAYHTHYSVPCFFPLNNASYRLFRINMYKFVSFLLTVYSITFYGYTIIYSTSSLLVDILVVSKDKTMLQSMTLYILLCVPAIYQ